MTKGGYNGVRSRKGHECPICREQYERYIPADDDHEITGDVDRVCVAINHGNHASGGYVHREPVNDVDNNAVSRNTIER